MTSRREVTTREPLYAMREQLAGLSAGGRRVCDDVPDEELGMLLAAGVTAGDLETAIDRWIHPGYRHGGSHWGYIRTVAWGEAVKRAVMRAQLLKSITTRARLDENEHRS